MHLVRWLIAAASLSLGCHAARILAVFPAPSRSHLISSTALTKELAARGHQVTVASMFPQDKPLANYTDVAVPFSKFDMEDMNMFDRKGIKAFLMFQVFLQMGGKTCEHFLSDPGVQKLIAAKDDSFDLLLVGLFFNECFLGFAHKFGVPVIGLAPMGGMHWMLDIVGNPGPYAHVPSPIQPYTDRMSFTQRLVNTLTVTLEKAMRSMVMLPKQDAVMRKYFNGSGPGLPYIADLESKTSLILLNNHASISYPKPYLPNVVEVGGMHIKAGQKLPSDLQKYLDEAKDGVVYFSMGSNLKSSQMPAEKRQAILDAFSTLKQRVLWKWEEETLPGQPENVKLGKWLPQSPILEHPNVRVFVTHGGLLSMQESVYHAVPMIGIPIYGDQELNMNRAEELGFGIRLSFANITSESLQWALSTVLNQPSYRENAERLSARFRDQPQSPLERAVFWTEYVIRHGGAAHMRCATLDLAWYQYLLLDVMAALLCGAGLAVVLVWAAIKAVGALVCKARNIQATKKQN